MVYYIMNFIQQHEKFWWHHHFDVFMTSSFIFGDIQVENQKLPYVAEILYRR